MQPVRVEHVDLVRKRAKRGETGRVPGHIEGGANSFRLVQRDLRGRQLRLAMRPRSGLLHAFPRLRPFTFFQRFQSPLLRREEQFGKGFVAKRRVNEKNNKGGKYDSCNVKRASQSLPAGAAGIIKNWLSHGGRIQSYAVDSTRSICGVAG